MKVSRKADLVECGLGKFVLDPQAQALVIWRLDDNPQVQADIIKREKGQFYYYNTEDGRWWTWSGISDSNLIEVLNMYEILPKEETDNVD